MEGLMEGFSGGRIDGRRLCGFGAAVSAAVLVLRSWCCGWCQCGCNRMSRAQQCGNVVLCDVLGSVDYGKARAPPPHRGSRCRLLW